MGLFGWLKNFTFIKKPRKIKLGLALGSGGAKGFAELGAIKAFEENGIEFDVIAGTSIGSIIGAFYANGYTSSDIVEMLKRINFGDITNTFMLKMDTAGLNGVIEKNLGVNNIEELKKPFRTVATNLDSGDAKVFSEGDVSSALCASSCMPPFFKPVIIDRERYIDGAFVNSVPADLVKEMGADYIVGIDLSTRDAKPSILSQIFPTYQSKVKEPWAIGYKYSNVMLHPDLTGFSAVSFSSGDKMFEIGYKTALEFMPTIKKDLEKLKIK